MQAFEKAHEVEKKIRTDTQRIWKVQTRTMQTLLDNYSHALHDFEVAGGYEMEHRTAEVLEGLGFSTAPTCSDPTISSAGDGVCGCCWQK